MLNDRLPRIKILEQIEPSRSSAKLHYMQTCVSTSLISNIKLNQGSKPYLNQQARGGKPYLNQEARGGKPYLNQQARGGRPYLNQQARGGKPYLNQQAGESKPYL